jgi:hypothetical protein
LPRAHEAQAALTFVQPAIPRTDVALDAAILQDVPIPPRFALDGLIHFALGLSFLNASENGDLTKAAQDASGFANSADSGGRPVLPQ